MEKDQLLAKLEEGKQVVVYYLESLQNSSLEASKVKIPQDELVKVSTLIHSHVTKMGLVYKPPIKSTTYNACSEELTNIVKTFSLLSSLLRQFQLAKDQYSSLYVNELFQQYKTLNQCIVSFFGELFQLVELQEEEESGDRLINVGRIWECCDGFKNLSQDGSSGALKLKLKESNKLIADALEELDEWIENPHMQDENDGFGFSDEEKEEDEENYNNNDSKPPVESEEEEIDSNLIDFAKKWSTQIKLIKLLISTLDKSIPKPTISTKFGTTIDSLNERRLQLNEYVDELIASVVWDMDLDSSKDASEDLIKCANSVIQLVSKLNNNDEKKIKWLTTWKVKFSESSKTN